EGVAAVRRDGLRTAAKPGQNVLVDAVHVAVAAGVAHHVGWIAVFGAAARAAADRDCSALQGVGVPDAKVVAVLVQRHAADLAVRGLGVVVVGALGVGR